MRNYLLGLLVAAGACSTNSTPVPIPEGNWDVTLTFTTGNCAGLPNSFNINFDITDDATGGFNFTAEQGLGGTNISGVMVCDPVICTLDFTDEGPGTLGSNVDTQTINATFDLDGHDTVTGDGSADLLLVGGQMCTQQFTAVGDVVR